MRLDIPPFQFEISTTMLAGSGLWSLALYLSWASLRHTCIELLERWFNFAERSLYTNPEEFAATRNARESQNAFYASVFSIIPFLILGGICNWAVEWGLGRSWSISWGILACIACGVYELGRQNNS
jgi:hypothetical protein